MSKINLLEESLINKIAAGEVIERPAAVVKELIENSLDAKATRISIDIADSGKKLIRIVDNGTGMDEEDAKRSILRHTTSKIKSTEDLFAINTLGFRGEALASVAAISQFSLTTQQENQLEGFNLIVEGGNIRKSTICPAEKGTSIEIRDIFFNTPARKKFLKTDSVELRHIIDIVTKYALANDTVSFKLTHNNHELLNSPAVNNQQDNISSVYGLKVARELLEVKFQNEAETINVHGFVSKPYDARNDKNQQNIFVNGRWVKNEDLNRAIYDAYHSLLFLGKHPIFVLHLEVNPSKIDVNVHPTKQEIKFEQKKEVENTVFTAVKETLQRNNLIPVMNFETEEQVTFVNSKVESPVEKKEVKRIPSPPKYQFEPSEQKMLDIEEETTPPNQEEPIATPVIETKDRSFNTENPLIVEKIEQNVKLPQLKVLGQIHKTFFVAETPGGILFIDQHVVQERILYERFMEQLLNKRIAVQNLLKGEVLEFTSSEKINVLDNKEKLARLGFQLEEFGENTFVLKTIPTLFGRLQPKEVLYELLNDFSKESGKNRLEEVQEEIITRMACRASVKAGDTMTILEIQNLLEELKQTKLPYTCPHGRAILIKMNVDELEKKFHRKG